MNYTYADKCAVLNDFILQQNENIRAVERKRSWRPSERAMAAATYEKRKAVARQIIEDLDRLEGLEK